MSTLTIREKRVIEEMLRMSSGYVLDFSDRTMGEFIEESIGIDVYTEKYFFNGTSKAKILRALWEVEPDYIIGKLLKDMIQSDLDIAVEITPKIERLSSRCLEIANRLLSSAPKLTNLKAQADKFDADHMARQIRRIEDSINDDPSLAIGTAKELIETCCKTILYERGKQLPGTPNVSDLTKATLKELSLVPEGISDAARGANVIKRLLSNLGTIGNGLAELRGLYGTGHGQLGTATGLAPRHARLAVSAASTLCVFLFETHQETQ